MNVKMSTGPADPAGVVALKYPFEPTLRLVAGFDPK
jgi:hypothetical protein